MFFPRTKSENANRIQPNDSCALVNPRGKVDHDGKLCVVCVNGYDVAIKFTRKLHNSL